MFTRKQERQLRKRIARLMAKQVTENDVVLVQGTTDGIESDIGNTWWEITATSPVYPYNMTEMLTIAVGVPSDSRKALLLP